jgi:hypothetical protein
VADLLGVLQAEIRPTRMRCVTLPLSVLGQALDGAPAAGQPPSAPSSRSPRP